MIVLIWCLLCGVLVYVFGVVVLRVVLLCVVLTFFDCMRGAFVVVMFGVVCMRVVWFACCVLLCIVCV